VLCCAATTSWYSEHILFLCRRCHGLTANQFCRHIVLLVKWGDGKTTGLRQFDDWSAAALAEALDVTIFFSQSAMIVTFRAFARSAAVIKLAWPYGIDISPVAL